jgi:hypothetical protein
MTDERITWYRGQRRPGPMQTIGVLEVRGDGSCRAVFAERAEIEGRAHIQLARRAWGPKDSLDTRWWSLVLDPNYKAYTVRTGSCGDPLTAEDVPRIVRALEELGLLTEQTMIHLDDGPATMPGRGRASGGQT